MTYDAIVLGLGGIGSAAVYEFTQRGLKVLGLDRFGRAHARGSSHGQTRIIRQAYFEHPAYVPLARRSFDRWRVLEERRGQKLYHEVGLLQVGPGDGEVITGVLRSAREHHLAVESLTAHETQKRFRGFVLPETDVAVFEQRAGYLLVEACVAAHLDQAAKLGAELHYDEPARQWAAMANEVTVSTDRGTYTARHLVVTAGAWTSEVLADLGLPLTVLRKPQLWYRPIGDQYHASSGCPTFLFETPGGIFYGFPQLGPEGVKVAEHTGGAVVADPLTVNRTVGEADRQRVEAFCVRSLPALSAELTRSAVCMYTMTPDRHFVVGLHPRWKNVAIVAGLSGHGFKFAPVLGEAVANLAMAGSSGLAMDFLGPARAALQ